MFSVCDGKTGIGAGDNDIAVANYLNAEIITNYLNASHDTPHRITRLIPLHLVHGGPYGAASSAVAIVALTNRLAPECLSLGHRCTI